ncbi:hypothetical protein [Occultella gossypii]|uniref:PH domain-containing protein n=1 Tax=Occultella gossypii TaxID=2800820 RepID=A0ABS7SA74_9MICO|nr:hypothetical protein [Occultella gossypii]MBZ2197253.1 hypothetical protein [Occultella gossypii]
MTHEPTSAQERAEWLRLADRAATVVHKAANGYGAVSMVTGSTLLALAEDALPRLVADVEWWTHKVGEHERRMWASVQERAVWDHERGEHDGPLPVTPCPICEREVAIAEVDGMHALIQRQGDLLTGVVNALRGDPPPLVSWSHHDAPELAADAEAEVERLTARTVTTAAELDALPVGSVVLDRDGDAWQKGAIGRGWSCTVQVLNSHDQPSHSVAAILGPLTVAHVAPDHGSPERESSAGGRP